MGVFIPNHTHTPKRGSPRTPPVVNHFRVVLVRFVQVIVGFQSSHSRYIIGLNSALLWTELYQNLQKNEVGLVLLHLIKF